MQSRILGTTMPVLEFLLDPNDSVISEAGELSWMSQSIAMQTHTQMAGGGGLRGVIKRVAGGGTLFMTEYMAIGAPGEVAFATRIPGHIVPVQVGGGGDQSQRAAQVFVAERDRRPVRGGHERDILDHRVALTRSVHVHPCHRRGRDRGSAGVALARVLQTDRSVIAAGGHR